MRALESAIIKNDASEIARLIDQGAPLDGWEAMGPYWVTPGHIDAPPNRLQCNGAIGLAVEWGCGKDVFSVLLSAGAHIPDDYGDPSLGRVRWKRRERRHQSILTDPGNISKQIEIYEMVEKSWLAEKLQKATPQSTAMRSRSRL